MGTTAPIDYLICDGTTYNIADYPEITTYFTSQFGSVNYFGGDGTTTFAVPDLRGEFLRGTGINSYSEQGSGANVGVHQDATKLLSGSIAPNNSSQYFYRGQGELVLNEDSKSATQSIRGPFGSVSVSSSSSNYQSYYYTRPTNTSVLYCIKIR